MKLEEEDTGCIPSIGEMGNMTDLSQGCDTGRVKALQLPHHLLRNSRAFSLVRLSEQPDCTLHE